MVELRRPVERAAGASRSARATSARVLRRLDWLLLLAVGRARRLRALGGRGDHAVRRPGRPGLLRRPAGDRRRRRRRRAGRRDPHPAVAVPAPLAGPLRRHDRADGLRLRFAEASAARSAGSTSARSSSSRPSSASCSSCSRSPASSPSGTRRIGGLGPSASAIGLGPCPLLLVFLQPDLGTALVYAAALAAVLFLAGIRWLHLALLAAPRCVVAASSGCSRRPASRC